jgi:hypothetical protein
MLVCEPSGRPSPILSLLRHPAFLRPLPGQVFPHDAGRPRQCLGPGRRPTKLLDEPALGRSSNRTCSTGTAG